MLETFLATLSPMLVMFSCILIGFILRKKELVPENSDMIISKLENYICVPALILSTFMSYCTTESLSKHYTIIIYSIFSLALAFFISFLLSNAFAKRGTYKRCIYMYALTFGNFSFMGTAIVPAILGATDGEILYKYLLFTLALNLAVYTWGVTILIPKKHRRGNPLKNLINPIFISVIIGSVFGLTGANNYIPKFILTTIDYCKNCMAPLAMILTGFVIGGYSLKELLSNKKVYAATVLRLFIIPAVILVLLKLLGASDLVLTLALFAYATPLGMNTVVFPAAYGGETQTGASMAMISHTLCIFSVPLMYALLLWCI